MKIAHGHLTLIGPTSSFGSYFNGPYYYYLFAPILWLFNGNHYSVLWANVVYFLFALSFFAWTSYKKFGFLPSALAAMVIAIYPPYLAAARNPWNGTAYLSLFLILLTLTYFYEIKKPLALISVGLLAGVIMNIHFSTPLIIVPLLLLMATASKRKGDVLWLGIGVLITFAPLVLFEFRHNFVMFRNTFINKGYGDFILNNQFPNGVSGKNNFFENMIFIAQNIQLGIISPFFVFVFLVWAWLGKKTRSLFVLNATLITGFVLFSAILIFKFREHYVYSLMFIMLFAVVMTVLERKWSILLVPLLIFTVINFPLFIYSDSFRTGEPYEMAVEFAIDHHLVNKKDKFNVLQMSKAYGKYVIVGNEYRFFFEKNGYAVQPPQSYANSDILLIFSELKDYDINTFVSWETDQFGRKNFSQARRFESDGISIYRIQK